MVFRKGSNQRVRDNVARWPPSRQTSLRTAPVTVAEEADLVLQGVFRDGSVLENGTVGLEEYATGVTSYISPCVGNTVPTKHIRTYPNQKPWINCEVWSSPHAQSTASVSGNPDVSKKARYDLCGSIKEDKRQS